MRADWKFWLIAPLLCAWPLSAGADDSDAAKLVSDCGAEDLPQSSIDSCLERVRVLEETEPSADLQSLEASLERRASGENSRRLSTSGAEAVTAAPTDLSRREDTATSLPMRGPTDEPATQQNADSQPPTGPDADDQPPIADSDDTPPPSDLDDTPPPSDRGEPDNPG
jgi:hypothetical protein